VHPGDEGPRSPARRRRRTPEVAEREIIAAAEAFLREQPFRAMTVDEVMRRTDLSRPSFYVYFRDRHHLVLRVVEHLGSELYTMSERWLRGTGEGPQLAREALEGVVTVYAEHGPVMRALADAAADDPGVEEAYNAIVENFVRATARHIEEEIAVGRILPVDPHQTAKALVWMMERYLNLSFGHDQPTPRQTVADTLTTIWTRVLYGVSDGSAGGG
jgi:TetR/AcrR family transcriptional regulator, ethionamide resistance regulator